jgi:GT2 family glycosyltransferase/tetratricopeptide (TPR) repeat protein
MSERKKKTVAAFHLHDDNTYLGEAIGSLTGKVPIIAFVSRVPWNGEVGDWERTAEIAEGAGAEVHLGDWSSENEHRRAAIAESRARGYDYMLIPDGDEIVEDRLLETLLRVADEELGDRVYVEWDTYWKSPEYVIRPREGFRPCLMINLKRARQTHLRDHEGGCPLFLDSEHGIVHHLSYVGPDERIQRKTSTWSHRDEVVPGWWEDVWCAWDNDRNMKDLHPTHPGAYKRAMRIPVPDCLAQAAEKARTLVGEARREFTRPSDWPRLSIVIPAHGASHLLRACLESIAEFLDLVHEVIVVDNASPDDCIAVCGEFDFVKVIENSENMGFARACNQGITAASGEVVVFLNSDTVVPREGVFRLIEPLTKSRSLAATGPLTNNCGHLQRIDVPYTDVSYMRLFADDFAQPEREPIDVDMLVGFCLAVRSEALEQVGGFDERFGYGTFEDNDLCYRLRRTGWRLAIVPNAFVHHEGSQTLVKVVDEVGSLLEKNNALYLEKWKDDLSSGFASHLSGMSSRQIVFDESKDPLVRAERIERMRQEAGVSLCMIVKNEERVLKDCLDSARPFFKEMIVVDTGSTDRTVEIAESCGSQIRHMEWPDSFSVARNESIRDAAGKWIFWMDADDTLPIECGEAILDAAIKAEDDVLGFVVPVQFVDDGPGGGTRVDHVKLFRNLPGLQFEGRIHEQILGSLRQHEGRIARCNAYVLHSGYDTSEDGQKKKRVRDEKLLMLDLQDRPDHPFVLFNLGMTAHYTDGHEEAVKWFERCLIVSEPRESHVRKAYALKAVSHRQLGETETALKTLYEGLSDVGDDPELHFHLGLILSNEGRNEEALAHYRKVLECDPSGYFSSMDVGILGFKTHHNTGGVLIALDRYDEAKYEFLTAIQQAPHFLPSAFELFDQALARRDYHAAQLALDHVKTQEGQNKSWAEMTIKYSESVGGPENVLATMEPIVPWSPQAQKSYAIWLLRNGMEQEASKHWRLLQQMGDAESAYFLGVHDVRQGRFAEALKWMRRAQLLNPEHVETARQIDGLERALAAQG